MVRWTRVLALSFAVLLPLKAWTQSGGTQSVFVLGVGARALGLGSAFVAMPQDPTTIYWNPAGLDHLQRKGITTFYTNLLDGTKYYFLGYTHPTIRIGTFGVGVIHVGVGDIRDYDSGNDYHGNFSFGQTQVLFSYGKQLPWSVSVGLNVKVENQAFGVPSMGKRSDSGVGADIGLLYQPNFTSSILQNLSIGLNIQNAYQAHLKPGEESEAQPRTFRLGAARTVRLQEENALTFFMDLDKGTHHPLRLHLGSEYSYQNHAMLRLGFDDGQIAFGAGAAYQNFQLDYSYARFAEGELGGSHRVSLTFTFGKTKDELIQIAKEEEARRVERELAERLEWQRKQDIDENMKLGQQAFDKGDYREAFVRFSAVLQIDNSHPEALAMLDKTNAKLDEQREEEFMKKFQAQVAERSRLESLSYINEHIERGVKYLQVGNFRGALAEWNLVLDRDPDNALAKEWISKAREELHKKVRGLMAKADDLARRNQYPEAMRVLDEARTLTLDEEELRKSVMEKISQYEKQLNVLGVYQQGLNYYMQKDFKAARDAFARAMELDPKNPRIRQYYERAKARAQATVQEMPPEVKDRYLQGVRYFNEGKYQEALRVWNELLQVQPYNKRILDNIDEAEARLQKQK